MLINPSPKQPYHQKLETELLQLHYQLHTLTATLQTLTQQKNQAIQQRIQLENELEDLTQLLFQEANTKVQMANMKYAKEKEKRMRVEGELKKLERRWKEWMDVREVEGLELKELKRRIFDILGKKSLPAVPDRKESFEEEMPIQEVKQVEEKSTDKVH